MIAEIQKTYKVKFNSTVHDGKVILIGSKVECERHYDLIKDQEKLECESNLPKTSGKSSKKELSEIQTLKFKQIQLND